VQNCPAQALQLATEATLSAMARQRRLRTARLDARPWHAHPGDMPLRKLAQKSARWRPPRSEADKRAAAIRKRDFAEIVLPFNAGQAQQASERCLQCGEHSICEWTCPLHNHIPQWIERVQAGISTPPWRCPIKPTACRR
jgi:Fe-S-cluster-containing hydrogenase component 2